MKVARLCDVSDKDSFRLVGFFSLKVFFFSPWWWLMSHLPIWSRRSVQVSAWLQSAVFDGDYCALILWPLWPLTSTLLFSYLISIKTPVALVCLLLLIVLLEFMGSGLQTHHRKHIRNILHSFWRGWVSAGQPMCSGERRMLYLFEPKCVWKCEKYSRKH